MRQPWWLVYVVWNCASSYDVYCYVVLVFCVYDLFCLGLSPLELGIAERTLTEDDWTFV